MTVHQGSSPPISRLFFDIDDTLYSTSEFAETARRNSVQALSDIGVDADPDDLYQELQEVINEFSSNYPYHYDKLLLRLPDEALQDVDKDVAVASAVIAYHRTKHEELQPFPDVRSFLESLEESNIPRKPGVISEGLSVKQAEKILRLNLYPFFDPHAIFVSEKVGISKPNPKLFKTALQESDTFPSEAMMVGDRLEKDIAPAKEVGMISVHMNRVKHKSSRDASTQIQPDYTIESYGELKTLLQNEFDITLPD